MGNWWDIGVGTVTVSPNYDQTWGPRPSLILPTGTIIGDGYYQHTIGPAALFIIDTTFYRRYIPYDVWQHCGYNLGGVLWADLSVIDQIPKGPDLSVLTWDYNTAAATTNPCLHQVDASGEYWDDWRWHPSSGTGPSPDARSGPVQTPPPNPAPNPPPTQSPGPVTVTIRNGGLYRAPGDPHVWYIDGAVKRWVASEAALAACFPGQVATSVPLADATALGSYPNGADILDAASCPGVVSTPPTSGGGGVYPPAPAAPADSGAVLVGAAAFAALVVGGYEIASRV